MRTWLDKVISALSALIGLVVIFAIVGLIFRPSSHYPTKILGFAIIYWAGSRMLREGIESIKSLLGHDPREAPDAATSNDDKIE